MKGLLGAQGHGADNFGGRGGNIVKVTNLNNSGTGSLRDAVEGTGLGARVVVFEVSGVIQLSSRLNLGSGNLTVAFHTAPYPGITITHNKLEITQDFNYQLQHVRLRVGRAAGSTDGIAVLGSQGPSGNVYAENSSVAWVTDEGMSINGINEIGVTNVTYSRNICNEPLGEEPGNDTKGMLAYRCRDVTMIGNLFAQCHIRCPTFKYAPGSQAINNFSFNTHDYPTENYEEDRRQQWLDIIGNYSYRTAVPGFSDKTHCINIHAGATLPTSLFVEDNFDISYDAGDPWVTVNESKNAALAPYMQAFEPTSPSTRDLAILPHGRVFEQIHRTVGPYSRFRDRCDLRAIEAARYDLPQWIDDEDDVGGFETLVENTRTLTVPADPHVITPNGYTNLENWLHQYHRDVSKLQDITYHVGVFEVPPTDAELIAGTNALYHQTYVLESSKPLEVDIDNTLSGWIHAIAIDSSGDTLRFDGLGFADETLAYSAAPSASATGSTVSVTATVYDTGSIYGKAHVLTVETTTSDERFWLEPESATYDCTVFWGDGTSDYITDKNDPAMQHIYATPGQYTIEVHGTFGRPQYRYAEDVGKIVAVHQMGKINAENYESAYRNIPGDVTVGVNDSKGYTGNMKWMFRDIGGKVDVRGLNGAGVIDTYHMFRGCLNATEIVGFGEFAATTTTANVGGVTEMFAGCTALTVTPPLQNFEFGGIHNCQSMFRDCVNLVSPPLMEYADTANFTDISRMFEDCTSMIEFPNTRNWVTSNVTLCADMFKGCTVLLDGQFDGSSWDMTNVTDAHDMFDKCSIEEVFYNNTLIGFRDNGTPPNGLVIDFGTSVATGSGLTARNDLINTYSWVITDGT